MQIAITGCTVSIVVLVCIGGAFWSEGIVGPEFLLRQNKAASAGPVEAHPVAYTVGTLPAASTSLLSTPTSATVILASTPPSTSSDAPAMPTNTVDPMVTSTLQPSPALPATTVPVPVTPLPASPPELTAGSGLPEMQATRLVIPSLALDTPVVLSPIKGETWQVDHLNQAVGHLEGTASPGFSSNMVLAGHITLEPDGRDGPFIGLGHLNPGDSVIVYYQDKPYTYRIDYMTSVNPTDVQVTYPSTEPKLTLITCLNYDRSLAHYTDRLIVVGHLVNE